MPRLSSLLVSELIPRFLASQQTELAASSHAWYASFLVPFAKKYGGLSVDKLTAGLLSKWIATYPDASQYNAARTVVRACNWAVAEHLLLASPLRGFRKPAPTKRQGTVTPQQYALCVKGANPSLRDVVKFLYHTGCRPQELRAIESRWVLGSKIVLPLSKSKGKKKQRTIYLDNMALGIVSRLARINKTGPLFRNALGCRWTQHNLVLAFRRLRHRTGVNPLCAYQFRHAYITRLLERGIDIATVAALSGNSPAMVLEVYNHVGANEPRLMSIVRAG